MRALAVMLATVGGAGHAPVAPGTVASLLALPLLPALGALRVRSPWGHAAVVVSVLAAAVWAADRAEATLGHDDGRIVVDEVAGMVTAGLLVGPSWGEAVLVFGLFRLFDVTKPFPIGLVDRRVRGGLGCVGDDVIAGIYAGVSARVVLAVVGAA